MAVGGIAIHTDAIPKIVSDLATIKADSPKRGEVKWSNAKSYGGKVHKAYMHYLFSLIRAGRAHFHIRFSEMSEYDHSLSGDRRRIDTVSKAFYQLIVHRPIKYYGNKCSINFYPDDGECTAKLSDFLPAMWAEEYSRFSRENPSVKLIQPRCSASEPLLQLLDVTLGALAAARNGRHLTEGFSPIKRDLAEEALKLTGWPDIAGNCSPEERALNLWNAKPKIKRGR